MKRLIFLFAMAVLAGGALFAQNADADCREMFEAAKSYYLKNGKEKGLKQFHYVLTCGSEVVKQEAEQWLAEQERKSATVPKTANNSEIETFIVNGVAFKMVKVAGGTFQMGATSEQGSDAFDWEKPAHSVTLFDYYIGQTEVTQELWQAVMGSNPSRFTVNNQCPVEKVSWKDCQEFIEKLNQLTGRKFRLPTEAEWEYAARGGNKRVGYKYSGSNNPDVVAWYSDNSGHITHSVATKQANELGLYDMSGNVLEWCSNRYGDYSSNSQTNPIGPNTGSDCVLRGGSWFDGARHVRVSFRFRNVPVNLGSNIFGLRLAL